MEQVQQEATRNFALSGIADRDFGDDVLEAFATMNASNVYANFRRFLHPQGTWKFSFYPAQQKRDHGDAITILQLYIDGVQAAMIMTEIYVGRNDHGSRGSSVASFPAVAAMIMIYVPLACIVRELCGEKSDCLRSVFTPLLITFILLMTLFPHLLCFRATLSSSFCCIFCL